MIKVGGQLYSEVLALQQYVCENSKAGFFADHLTDISYDANDYFRDRTGLSWVINNFNAGDPSVSLTFQATINPL